MIPDNDFPSAEEVFPLGRRAHLGGVLTENGI